MPDFSAGKRGIMPTIVETVMFPAIVGEVKESRDMANDHTNIDHKYFNYFISISRKVGSSTKICTKF